MANPADVMEQAREVYIAIANAGDREHDRQVHRAGGGHECVCSDCEGARESAIATALTAAEGRGARRERERAAAYLERWERAVIQGTGVCRRSITLGLAAARVREGLSDD